MDLNGLGSSRIQGVRIWGFSRASGTWAWGCWFIADRVWGSVGVLRRRVHGLWAETLDAFGGLCVHEVAMRLGASYRGSLRNEMARGTFFGWKAKPLGVLQCSGAPGCSEH